MTKVTVQKRNFLSPLNAWRNPTAINAYYTLLAMELNAARYEAPKDGKKLPRFPE